MPVSSPGPIVRSLSFSTRMSQNLQNFISSSYNTNQSGQSVCLVSSIDSSVSTTADLTAASEDGCRTLSHARQNLILLLCSHFIKKKKKKKRKKKRKRKKGSCLDFRFVRPCRVRHFTVSSYLQIFSDNSFSSTNINSEFSFLSS